MPGIMSERKHNEAETKKIKTQSFYSEIHITPTDVSSAKHDAANM